MMVDKSALLIQWLQVLNNGRVRPDDPSKRNDGNNSSNCCNETGIVRDSKDFIELIKKVNSELEDILLK